MRYRNICRWVLLGSLLSVSALASACHGQVGVAEAKEPPAGLARGAAALPAQKVETAQVEPKKMPRYMTLTGTVMADRTSELAANVSGRVTATYVERGMPVRAGQIVAIVDSKAASLQATAAQAQSQAAQTQVELARRECERADALFAQGVLTGAEHDRMKSQCSAQIYQATAVQANADLAGKLAGDTVIRAPFAGVVGERYVNVGEYVTPPSRVASLFSVDPVRIAISVPEPAVQKVTLGQSLDVEVSAWPGKTFPAAVRFIGPALRPGTRDLVVEAFARNPKGELKPGMFATVRLLVGEDEQPTVPLAALRTDGTTNRLFLARSGEAFEMIVRTGETKDGRVALLEPLDDSAAVILNPPPDLHDGSAIQ